MGAILPLKRDHATQLPAEPQTGDNGLIVGTATLDASGLTVSRTLTLPDVDGAIAIDGLVLGGNISSAYTFVTGDANKLLLYSGASNVNFTVPYNAALPAGTVFYVAQYGSGKVTFVGGSSPPVSLLVPNGSGTLATGDIRAVVKLASQSWCVV